MKVRLAKPKKRTGRRKLLRFAFLLVVPFSLLFLVLWWNSPEEPVQQRKPAESSPEFQLIDEPHIGLLTQLSGPFHEQGEMLRMGVELAWHELQQKGAKGKLIVEDAGADSSHLKRVAKQMAVDSNLVMVIAHLPVEELLQVVPIFEKENVLVLVPAESHQELTYRSSIIPFVCPDSEEGAYAAVISERLAGHRPVGVIYGSDDYGRLLYDSFKQEAQRTHIKMRAFSCSATKDSISKTTSQVMKVNPPVLWLAGGPFWGAQIIRALGEKGYEGQFILPSCYSGMLIEDLLYGYLNRVLILQPMVVSTKDNPDMRSFIEKFIEKYWREPDTLAVLGYDAMNWFQEASGKSPISKADLRERFLRYDSPARAFKGVGGIVYFDEHGRLNRPLQLTIYRDGKFLPAPTADARRGS